MGLLKQYGIIKGAKQEFKKNYTFLPLFSILDIWSLKGLLIKQN